MSEHSGEKDVEALRERDDRLNAWLADVKPGDTVTVRLNSTDTLTGKVYEAPDARGTSLCVWTTVLRHGNGYPGPSYEPVAPASPDAGTVEALVEASSLGTPEAKALRATVSDEHAARIVARAAELEDVEALRVLLAALRYGSHTFTTHEMAERILASDWFAAHTAAAEARGAERGARGVRWRGEVACDGYAHLMDEDVPSNESDLAAYQQGAHDAAEAIRAVLIEGGA